MYAVAGRCTALAASGDCIGQLWNPSGGEAITVHRVEVWIQATASNTALDTFSTAGTTPGATVTPDLDNDFHRTNAPSSSPVLYLGNFATEPVSMAIPDLMKMNSGAPGSPVIYDLSMAPVTVPPGSGLGVVLTSATATVADITIYWEPGSTPTPNGYWAGSQCDGLTTAELVWCNLWNPHATKSIFLHTITFTTRSVETTEYIVWIVRTTARGTATTTRTPDKDNHCDQIAAPASGALLDVGYGTEPTMSGSVLYRFQFNGRGAGGITWTIPVDDDNGIDLNDCIEIPAGTGLCIRKNATGVTTTTKEVAFGWFE